MFIFFTLSVALAMAPLVVLAGWPARHYTHLRSRTHMGHLHGEIPHNHKAPKTKARKGPMTLQDKHQGPTFFEYVVHNISIEPRFNLRDDNSGWDFFTGSDPTNGKVNYTDKYRATSSGLAFVGHDNVTVMAVDDKSVVPVGGNRNS